MYQEQIITELKFCLVHYLAKKNHHGVGRLENNNNNDNNKYMKTTKFFIVCNFDLTRSVKKH